MSEETAGTDGVQRLYDLITLILRVPEGIQEGLDPVGAVHELLNKRLDEAREFAQGHIDRQDDEDRDDG